MDEPPHKKDPASDFTFLMFLRRFRESNFLKFVVFSGCLTFATYLAAPFFAVFMLRDLQLSYLTYMGLQVGSSLAALIALPLWGRHADLVGNVRVLRLSSFLAALIPIFWLLSHNPAYLMLVQIFAGFSWSGVTLSSGNFIYDAVTPQKRVRCIAYFNVIMAWRFFWVLAWAAISPRACRRFSAIACSPYLRSLVSAECPFTCYSRAVSAKSEPRMRLPSRSFFSASSAFARWWARRATDDLVAWIDFRSCSVMFESLVCLPAGINGNRANSDCTTVA